MHRTFAQAVWAIGDHPVKVAVRGDQLEQPRFERDFFQFHEHAVLSAFGRPLDLVQMTSLHNLLNLPREGDGDYRRFATMLGPGDLIFHPSHGFGTISGLTRRDPLHPIQDVVALDDVSDPTHDYYDIQLMGGGTLLVPVNRAERVGLRLLTNGVDAITICLRSPAQELPRDARKRAAELWARGQISEPTALATCVRDMVTHSHGRTLTASEKAWLDKSCERLSTEAALVDRISQAQAYAAIWEAVNRLNAK